MSASYDKNAAVVVLPPVGGGRLRDPSLRHWLAQADLSRSDAPTELLARILGEIGRPTPNDGIAAMRMWGQTGDRPTAWIAAADPVYLEPRLDHLCLHALRRTGLPAPDLRALFDHLQAALGDEHTFGFARVGSYGYVTSSNATATAELPAYAIDHRVPTEYLRSGDEATDYRLLLSEIEMALHDHPVNHERESQGLPPINSLWIWGGGYAPETTIEPHPPLFSDDPLLQGYWMSRTGVLESWSGDVSRCLEASVAGFVAAAPEFSDDIELLEDCLHALRRALQSRRLSKLILLFRDGIRASVQRSHALRVWRRQNDLLEEPGE